MLYHRAMPRFEHFITEGENKKKIQAHILGDKNLYLQIQQDRSHGERITRQDQPNAGGQHDDKKGNVDVK